EVFDAPVVGQVARALGGIRVDRASGSGDPLVEAAAALRAGELVAILPQGTIPRGRAFFDPALRGRWGAARLAAEAGVPVGPIGPGGAGGGRPRARRVPRNPDRAPPPAGRGRGGPAGRGARGHLTRGGHRPHHGRDRRPPPAGGPPAPRPHARGTGP